MKFVIKLQVLLIKEKGQHLLAFLSIPILFNQYLV